MTDRTPPAVHLHIGGERLSTGAGGTHAHIHPATGQEDAQIPLADKEDIDRAVTVAHAAYHGWRRTPPAERRRLLLRLADLIDDNAAEFARLGTLDNGTAISGNAAFPPLASAWTRYYAGWADKITGEVEGNPLEQGEFQYTLMEPYGVIGIVITWNGPLISLAMKIPPAVAAGNTVVVKPSELTPFTGELFMELVEQAGFPPGVINLLPGTAEAGHQLVTHDLVKKVTFTGGPATATRILEACAPTMKPVVLELGGKSANIVFPDADLQAACAHGVYLSIAALSGQGCAFPTRMIVHESIHDQVVETVKAVASTITVGDPFDPATVSGPVVNQAAIDRIMAMIERAEADGAELVTGGNRIDRPGYFVEPTIFTHVDPSSELAQNEVFGPVLAITTFSSDEEAVEIANATRYGLSSYIQTRDLDRALRVAAELETGEVLINGAANLAVHRPFGGIGVSGVGKEGGRAGFEEFLRMKGVGVKLA
jgi:aldehyde dehydrogenase (NAD+)